MRRMPFANGSDSDFEKRVREGDGPVWVGSRGQHVYPHANHDESVGRDSERIVPRAKLEPGGREHGEKWHRNGDVPWPDRPARTPELDCERSDKYEVDDDDEDGD